MNVAAPTPAQPVTCARHATGAKPAANAEGGPSGPHPSMLQAWSAVPVAFELGASGAERLPIGVLRSPALMVARGERGGACRAVPISFR